MWQKETQFTTNDNRLFYNITREECYGVSYSDPNINFFQEKTTVYFEIESNTSAWLDTLDYSIARINGNLTLHIIGYYNKVAFCLHKDQISGYLIFYLDQIDAVDLSYIYKR